MGEERELRDDSTSVASGISPARASLLVVALDGVGRDVLYELLDDGELPGLASLLGGRDGDVFPHAWFAGDLTTTMPSATIPAWATIFTGTVPAEHGVVGNEFFDRTKRSFAAPVPVSFSDLEPLVRTYTDSRTDRLLEVPTVYHRLHALDPEISIWVSMVPFHGGADRLIAAQRSALLDVVPAVVRAVADGESMALYQERDQELLDTVIEELDEEDGAPDVLTVYVSGSDQYAHAAPGRPEHAQRRFLRGRIDAMFGELAAALRERGALEGRYVVVISDHGHTDVRSDDSHRLGDRPARVFRDAGFRPRPFRLEVAEDDSFSAVLAYQGAVAFAYVADRSSCPGARDVCDWERPPRFEADVLAAAEAFRQANVDGPLRDTLELILVRRPSPSGAAPRPFEVYEGPGRVVPLEDHLETVPRPAWVDLPERLCDLAVGRFGARAGDLLLFARNATADSPVDRYYFHGSPYESGHGSAAARDSEIPLIVAHPNRTASDLGALAHRILGPRPAIEDVADLLVALRFGGEPPPEAIHAQQTRDCP